MADTPEQAKEALSHITAALTANHDALGQIQDGLATAAENITAPNGQFVRSAKQLLGKRIASLRKMQAQQTAPLASQLGQAAVGVLGDSAAAVSALGNVAVGGRPSLVPQAAGTGITFIIIYRCDPTNPTPTVITSGQWSSGVFSSPPWYWFHDPKHTGPVYASANQAQAVIDTYGDAYFAKLCKPPAPPSPPVGGPPQQTGSIPATVTIGCAGGAFVYTWSADNAPGIGLFSGGKPQWLEVFPPGPGFAATEVRFAVGVDADPNGAFASNPTAWVIAFLAGEGITDNSSCLNAGDGGGIGDGVPLPPPPPPPPPPPECPPCEVAAPPPPPACSTTIPVLNCPVIVNGLLPQVGSLEWCQCIDGLAAWFDSVGQWLIDKVDGILAPSDGDNPTTQVQDVIGAVGGQLLGITGIGGIKNAIVAAVSDNDCIWRALKEAVSQFAVKTSTRLIGISVCRALLEAFSQLRLGWDLAVWGTVDIHIHINPLLKLLFYVENYVFQYEIPHVGEAIECYLYATASDEVVKCWMASHGANFDIYSPVIRARREKLTTDELIQVGRRHNLDDDLIAVNMRSLGWIDEQDVADRIELSYGLPSISDHLHWLQRNVFDDAYVQGYDLLNGFAEKFWPKFGHDLHALGMREEYAKLHYAAHWIIPPMGQLAEMAQRLRPGRVDDSITFTWDDFRTLLAEQDVAPFYRERLEAIAYRTLPLRQLNAATQQGRFDETELAERWQDIGFTPDDAKVMAKTSLVQAARQVESQIHGFTAGFVSELLQYGLVPIQDATTTLAHQGYTADQVDTLATAARLRRSLARRKRHEEGVLNAYSTLALQAYEDGVVDAPTAKKALADAGYDDPSAALAIATVDLRVQKATIDLATKSIHKAFLFGAVGSTDAMAALQVAGVQPGMAAVLVKRWQLEMSVPRKAASAAAIVRWVAKGIMSVANARIRLGNLGYADIDIDLQIAEVEQAVRQSQQLAAQRRTAALAKAQQLAQQAVNQTQKQFCKLYTPARLTKWYKLGIIDGDEFKSRLAKCGTSPDDVESLFKQAQAAKGS